MRSRVATLAWVVGVLVLSLLGGCTRPGGPMPADSSSGTPASSRPPATSVPPGTSPGTSPDVSPTASVLRLGRPAWVAVSVATLWREPSSPRAVDQPALRAPADIRGWLSALTDADRRGLSGRADTQALLGDRVVVVARSGPWVKVVVPDQPTPLDARGYPGWVPAVQLTAIPPVVSSRAVTVVAPTAWLYADQPEAERAVEVSFGTRLPYLSTSGSWVRVGLPGSGALRVRASDVSVVPSGAAALPATGAARVASAERFLGLPYLWAGTSGFGFDCSGLTHLVLRVHGVAVARDAGPQSRGGQAVAATALRPGDLLFYAASGSVHHVTMYVGNGRMIHAPRTGAVVEVVPVTSPSLADEFAVARRY